MSEQSVIDHFSTDKPDILYTEPPFLRGYVNLREWQTEYHI